MKTYKIRHEKNCSNNPFRLQIYDVKVWKDVHLYVNDNNSNIAEFGNPMDCEKIMDEIGSSYDIISTDDSKIVIRYRG